MSQKMDADPLGFLVGDASAFLKATWEQRPAVVKASPERRAFFDGLFSFGELQRLCSICEQEGEVLEFGVDVNAARYVGGRRETPNGEVADAASLARLYREEGCTMQVHQPQRFSDELWRLLAALEARLGCLVGSNAYLTPAGTQGLAPHWDDVEIFVVQTEGSKRWRLYKPQAPADAAAGAGGGRAALIATSHLANQVSGDLEESEIGEPVMEFTLEVGDVLYMPRGTIHQAAAQGGDSAHLTISTYQRWSCADLLQAGAAYTVSVALANQELQPLLPAPLKAGLPLRWLSAAGVDAAAAAALAAGAGGFGPALPALLQAAGGGGGGGKGGGSDAAGLARQLAAACRSMADALEDADLGPRFVQTAADAMAEDYMRSRLPPHPAQLPPRGPAPTLDDAVQCVGAGLFRLVPLRSADHGHGHEHDGCGSDCEEEGKHYHHDHHHHEHHEHAEGEACGAGCQEAGRGGGGGGFGAPPAFVRLVSCLANDRDGHMMSGGGEEEEEEEESSDEEEDSGLESEEEEGGSGSEDESEGEGEEAGGDMRAQLARLAAAAERKRQEMEAAGAAFDDDDEEGKGDEEEEEEEEGEEEREEEKEESEDDDEEEGEGPEDLVFPAEFAPALAQVLRSGADAGGGPLRVRHLALPDPELQLQVAAALWDAGVLHVVKPQDKPQKKKEKKGQQAPPAQAKAQGGGKGGKAAKAAGGGAQPAAAKDKPAAAKKGAAGKRPAEPAAAGGEKRKQGKGGAAAGPKAKKHKA